MIPLAQRPFHIIAIILCEVLDNTTQSDGHLREGYAWRMLG
ncbi:hypothetical protein MBOL_32920 [Mycobacteroides abscessus subsp. bolletii BD]|uniref:Uncharacterized protein n=1 Tax=Mycobacteroides abscessus MAB_030201_1075 TaxID=1335410 RepID=A0A829PTL8_9MYCO|nr:hypothetical protein MBOL_32920 [Mycobacteroides abscessus subsp. bolletii BD]EIV08007.1 hypothetical protein MA4S0206_3259 [Mycobacteroides abscessus 4S-0206]EIV22629.1 hypothetical protein MA3A0119R_3616 [Mycobacteroides abscessus 3A-0119-R]EIV25422.1 hypothetical protein MA3A0122R_3704 [Mycobacteroides abscessus 3A-0122-R]EIV33199.1 hypothetical protein MA3A0122S_3221 [Mycobacteroides abscessus 3A-0122-S]EIV37345.1 hypothetical protein MA3A0731_3747 [Mycobacteroides abscessus 3A-0731]EI